MTVGRLSFAGVLYQDGASGAPAGTPQYPTLLSGYTKRPPWNVAGVDYAVGYPAGQSLIDISISQPAGTSFSNGVLTVNADNVTIDGYDFSLYNSGAGVRISCPSHNNLTVVRCRLGGTSYPSIGTGIIDFRGNGLAVKYCVIDGGDTTGAAGAQCVIFCDPASDSGIVVVQYNWIKNYGSQIIEFEKSATLDYRFNLIDDTIVPSGAHQNYLQWGSGTANSPVYAFNTTRQLTGHGGAEGPQFYFNTSGTMLSPTCSNNTFLAPGTHSGGTGTTMSNIVHGSAGNAGTTLTGTALAQDNYFDPSGANFIAATGSGAWYPSSMTGWIGSGNVNMVDGTSLDGMGA